MGADLNITGIWREDGHGEAGRGIAADTVFVGPCRSVEFYHGAVRNTVDLKISHTHRCPHLCRKICTIGKRRQGIDTRVDIGVHHRAADRCGVCSFCRYRARNQQADKEYYNQIFHSVLVSCGWYYCFLKKIAGPGPARFLWREPVFAHFPVRLIIDSFH